MSEHAPRTLRMTVAEFLEWNDDSDLRHELIDGRPVAMNPPTAAHALLVSHMAAAMIARTPEGCKVYTGGGTRKPDEDHNYRIPDCAVSCTPSDNHWIEEPRLVVEILSPSTERFDLTRKIEFFQSIATVDEILILRSERRWAQLWRRGDPAWSVQNFIGHSEVALEALSRPIPLDEIYAPLDL